MKNKIAALFPGSFDPFTNGHLSIIERALPIFDKIIIAIGINSDKKSLFSLEKRIEWLKKIFENEPKIAIETYNSLTVDYCKERNVKYLLRGLRTAADFEYERQIGQTNKVLQPDIDSVFFLTLPEHTHISSTIVKEIIKYKGNIDSFVPKIIANEIYKNYDK